MDREACALAAGLCDPHKPAFCTACLLCFKKRHFEGVEESVLKGNVRALRADHHDLWRSIMLFVTVKRTAASRASTERLLASTMRLCSSPFHTQRDHDQSRTELARYLLNIATGLLFDLVSLCLHDSSRRMLLTQKFSTKGLWPTSASDILAHGVEESLEGLLDWFATDSSVAAVFEEIFMVCALELRDQLMLDTNRRFFLQTTCTHLERAAAQHRLGGINRINPWTPEARVWALSCLLEAVVYGRGATYEGRRLLFRGFEAHFVRASEGALPLLANAQQR